MVSRFTTVDEVKSVCSLNNNEVSDAEIAEHIDRVTGIMIEQYGNPMEKSNIILESNEYIYDYTGNKRPTYRVDYVEVNGSEITNGTGSIYDINLGTSFITLASNIIDDNSGERLEVEYIPKRANLLCTYKSALETLESLYVVTGDEAFSTKLLRIEQTTGSLQNLFLQEVKVIMSTQGATQDDRQGKVITQNFDNQY